MVLVAWALRLYHLGTQSLWVDEGFSYEVARQGAHAILQLLPAEDRHPPLHYLLLWLTMGAAGQSELALRFVSAGAGILAIPLTYRLGRSLGGGAIGLIAATLLAISPFHVWYAQEARMYALLATLGLVSFLLWLRIVDARARPPGATLVAYVAVTAAALYTHYDAVFLLPAEAMAALLVGDRRRWRAAFAALALSGLLFVPWLPAVWEQAQRAPRGYQPEATIPAVLGSLASAYTLGDGVPDAGLLGVLVGLVALLGVLSARDAERCAKANPLAAARPARHGVVLLAWVLAAPLGAYLFSAVFGLDVRATGRMYYLGGLPPFLLLVARGVVWIAELVAGRRPLPTGVLGSRLVVPTGALALLGLLLIGGAETPMLVQQYRGRIKEDFRAAARLIEQREWPGDAIILDAEYIFRPFVYYYHGAAPWNRAVVEPAKVADALAAQTAGHDRVWLVLSHEDVADPAHRVQTWLDQHATPLDEQWLDGIHLRLYNLEPRPQFREPSVGRMLGIRLGGSVEIARVDAPAALAGGAVAHVRLVWHALARPDEADHAVLLLADGGGHVWWQTDRVPISPLYLPTQWQPGEYLTDDYDVPLPLGLEPGEYHLRLKLYSPVSGQALPASAGGDLIDLAAIQVGPSRLATLLPGADVTPGLRLVGASLSQDGARPGDTFSAELVWQATGTPAPASALALRLVDPSGNVALTDALATVKAPSFGQWQRGDVVRERVPLKLPARLAAGAYRVRIGDATDLGGIRVGGITRDYAAPAPAHRQVAALGPPGKAAVAGLLGYDLTPPTLRPGQTLRLGLYWQAAAETDEDFVVFTHLVGPNGTIYAQRDNPPAGGSRPTSGWLTGEVIRDDYDLHLDERAPPGTYRLEVGMYRPDTGVRLAVGDETAIVLDSPIQVAQTDAAGQ